MKQRFFRYALPLTLTLLCGLYFVHSNLKVEDTVSSDTKKSLFELNDVNQHASIGINPLSSDKKLAIEVAESEEQEEEVRHTTPSQNSKHLGAVSATLLSAQFLWHSLFDTKKSFAALSASDTTFPFRRYIQYQVFRL